MGVTLDVSNEAQLDTAIAEVDGAASGTFNIDFTGNVTANTASGSSVVYQGTTVGDPPEVFALDVPRASR